MSQVVVAELVLSEVERKPMPGLSPFLGGWGPWHCVVCREDIQVHPQVAFPTHLLRTLSWDLESTLARLSSLRFSLLSPCHPLGSHTAFRGDTIKAISLFMSQAQADTASYETRVPCSGGAVEVAGSIHRTESQSPHPLQGTEHSLLPSQGHCSPWCSYKVQ